MKTKQTDFQTQLRDFKRIIDADIAKYVKEVQHSTLKNYGVYSRLATDAFTAILLRGGKRIRGALTIVGYQMSGGAFDLSVSGTSHSDAGAVFSASTGKSRTSGTVIEARSRKTVSSAENSSRVASSAGKQAEVVRSTRMIRKAALAIEMLHAAILIIDDINDRSPLRRGGPSAHTLLADYYRQHNLSNDDVHFGESIAMNAAMAGSHTAQMLLANLDANPQLRVNALSVLNRNMAVTHQGQINDLFNEVLPDVDERDIDRVLEWKTAHYTFLNPLHLGMILAGADYAATDAITEYAMHAGRAFQITDDILGTFGEEFESGKSVLDDIREGKRTILTVYALQHASSADKNFLIQMLGNRKLTQAQFRLCKDILVESGALAHARKQAKHHVRQAIISLNGQNQAWSSDGIRFLTGLADYLLARTS